MIRSVFTESEQMSRWAWFDHLLTFCKNWSTGIVSTLFAWIWLSHTLWTVFWPNTVFFSPRHFSKNSWQIWKINHVLEYTKLWWAHESTLDKPKNLFFDFYILNSPNYFLIRTVVPIKFETLRTETRISAPLDSFLNLRDISVSFIIMSFIYIVIYYDIYFLQE